MLTPEEVERGYNNRAAVPEFQQWFDRWSELSEAARSALGKRSELDVRYGPGPKETLDIFLPERTPRATLVFIHGGYWRSLDKRDHAFVAPTFVREGIAVALLNYDLCPAVRIPDIVQEVRRALTWIVRHGASHGLATRRVVVSGHSAGGHLAAMLHATKWEALGLSQHPLAAGVSISGVHDLEPLLSFAYNSDLRLDAAEARAMSPIHLAPTTDAPFLVAVGSNETSEFLRQSDLLFEAWPSVRPMGASAALRVPERHHFSVINDYADGTSALARATLDLFD